MSLKELRIKLDQDVNAGMGGEVPSSKEKEILDTIIAGVQKEIDKFKKSLDDKLSAESDEDLLTVLASIYSVNVEYGIEITYYQRLQTLILSLQTIQKNNPTSAIILAKVDKLLGSIETLEDNYFKNKIKEFESDFSYLAQESVVSEVYWDDFFQTILTDIKKFEVIKSPYAIKMQDFLALTQREYRSLKEKQITNSNNNVSDSNNRVSENQTVNNQEKRALYPFITAETNGEVGSDREFFNTLMTDPSKIPATDKPFWSNLISERFKKVKEKESLRSRFVQPAVELMYILWDYGWLTKGETVDLNSMTLNWDKAKERFKAADALTYFDKLKQTQFYEKGIEPLLFMALTEMVTPGSLWKPIDWVGDDVAKLFASSHNKLISLGAAKDLAIDDPNYDNHLNSNLLNDLEKQAITYRRFLSHFEAESQNSFDNIYGLLMEVVPYFAAFNNLRELAMFLTLAQGSARQIQSGQPTHPAAVPSNENYVLKKNDSSEISTIIALAKNMKKHPMFGYLVKGTYYDQSGRIRLPGEVIKPTDSLVIGYLNGRRTEYVKIEVKDLQTDAHFQNFEKNTLKLLPNDVQKIYIRANKLRKEQAFKFLNFYFGEKITEYLDNNRINFNTLAMFPLVKDVLNAPLLVNQADPNSFDLSRNTGINMENYLNAMSSVVKIQQMAVAHYKKKFDYKDFRVQVDNVIQEFGTEIAKALAFPWDASYKYSDISDYQARLSILDNAIVAAKANPNLNYEKIKELEQKRLVIIRTIDEATKAKEMQKYREQDMINYFNKMSEIFFISLFMSIPFNDYEEFSKNSLDKTKEYKEYIEMYEILTEIIGNYTYTYGSLAKLGIDKTFKKFAHGGELSKILKRILYLNPEIEIYETTRLLEEMAKESPDNAVSLFRKIINLPKHFIKEVMRGYSDLPKRKEEEQHKKGVSFPFRAAPNLTGALEK